MRILHCLAQRPSQTGSGVTLDSLVRHAATAGYEQRVVVGVPASEPLPEVGGLERSRIHPLLFDQQPLSFPVPGMSDVMPYPSSRFSELSSEQIEAYCRAWKAHLEPILEDFEPEVIHSHHVWQLSSLMPEVAPGVPVVTHCHATGLRQMELCPHLAERVSEGCRESAAFAVLHRFDATRLEERLGIEPDSVHVVGAGYRDDLFWADGEAAAGELLYVGKLSPAKGLPWLLDAFEQLLRERPELKLHVVGGGSGPAADVLRRRMERLAPAVLRHGQVGQPRLAEIARRASVCVLPSFYEGLPLVLVEALACGCRLVATRLPGVEAELAPHLGSVLERVEPPRLEAVDRPLAEDLPAFVERLTRAIERALDADPIGDPTETLPGVLEPFRWRAVFERVEAIWQRIVR